MTARIYEEDAIQVGIIQWARHPQRGMNRRFPQLDLLYHVQNGGKRNIKQRVRATRRGEVAGIPDLHLPVGRGGFIGLYLEIKKPGGKHNDAQREIIPRLEAEGHRVVTVYSTQDGIEAISEYLKTEV